MEVKDMPVVDNTLRANIRLTHIAYLFHAIGAITLGWAWIVGALLNYIKRDDVQGTFLESHFTWQLRTFWWGLLWYVLGWIFFFTIIGAVIAIPMWIVAFIWVAYRIIKGWLALNDEKPINLG
jgi:uncharacterized membrane protein